MRGLGKMAAGIAAAALTVGVIAGCGSSSDTATTGASEGAATVSTTAELTKPEYVAKANAICRKIDDVTSSLGDNIDTETLEQAQAGLEKAVAAARNGVSELKGLVPPAGLAAAHATLVQTSGDATELGSRIISAALAGNLDDPALVAEAKQAETLEAKQLAAAKELGLSDCFTGNTAGDADESGADDGAND